MPEPGIRFLTFVRQRHPGLDAVHRTAVGPQLLEALGMGDTPARGHPVDLARPDRLLGADAVAMHDLAIEQVGDRRQTDMRMRTDIGLARQARLHQLGSHAVEEDVGARSEEHTSELQSLMRISYAVFCLKKKKKNKTTHE